MLYENLHELIFHSSSSRKYFLSLPVSMQMSLHEHNDSIHSAAELHTGADLIERYNHAIQISDYFNNQNK